MKISIGGFRHNGFGVWGILLLLVCGTNAFGQERFADLMADIPGSANAIVVIDVEAVHKSPIAIRDQWADRHEAAYVKSPILLPPESDRLVLAAQMNSEDQFSQAWELGLVSLTEPLSIKSIARAEGGYVDPISGMDAAWTPSDAYFVELGTNRLGVVHPANRQWVANWALASKKKQLGDITDYLKATAAMVQGPCQIAMGLDLQNVVRPHRLRESLTEAEWTKNNPTKLKQWEELFLGIQGVSLKVMLTETAHGVIRVDFAGNPSALGSDAKAVLLFTLDRYGMGIDELGDWKISLEDHAVLLEGELNDSALRKIFSLLELPSAKFGTVEVEDVGAEATEKAIVAASKEYFTSITTLIDDLRKEFRTNRDARHNLAGAYLDRYARRIDRLPILNVDEDLLNFGATVSSTMRDASVASKQAGIQSGVRKSSVYNQYQYNYDGNGYYTNRSAASVKTQIGREEEAVALTTRFNSWKEVEDGIAAIRKTLTQRYKVEF